MSHFKIDIFDILLLLAKAKKLLILIFVTTLITSYGVIYLAIEPQYDATAIIIPSGQNQLAGISSMVKNISSILPAGLSSINKESEMDLYNTIVYSRSCIEHLIEKFDLQKKLKAKTRTNAIKAVRKLINTNITMENAYTIRVRTTDPELSSNMTNYIIEYLNSKIIEMNIKKSQNNRHFLEKRYQEICLNLQNSEDSLRRFQETNGVLDAGNQLKSTIEIFAKLESDLAAKQVEYNVLQQLYGKDAPSVNSARLSVREFEKKLKNLKSGHDKNSSIIGLDSLPEKALQYYRSYRNVKINESILEIILPIYEQSKFEEQKDIPVLQIVDYAVPAEKKSFPPRTALALLISIMTLFFSSSLLVLKDIITNSNSPEILKLKKELLNFK